MLFRSANVKQIIGDSFAMFDELTFNLEDNFVEGGFHFEPYAKKLLIGA